MDPVAPQGGGRDLRFIKATGDLADDDALRAGPTPPEILVERVGFLRFAEAEKRFDQTLTALYDVARQAHVERH